MPRCNNSKVFVIQIIVLAIVKLVFTKTYTNCELAQELALNSVPLDQIPTWICIAKRTSNLKTVQTNHLAGYGIFGIGNKYWCSLNDEKKGCSVKCRDLENDDLTDDIKCIEIIYSRHKKISGNGYTAWDAYNNYCKYDTKIINYVKGCKLHGGRASF